MVFFVGAPTLAKPTAANRTATAASNRTPAGDSSHADALQVELNSLTIQVFLLAFSVFVYLYLKKFVPFSLNK